MWGGRECFTQPHMWLCLPNLTPGGDPVFHVNTHVTLVLVYFTWTELSQKLRVGRTLRGSASVFCSVNKCQTLTSYIYEMCKMTSGWKGICKVEVLSHMYLSQALPGQISLFEDESDAHYEISGTLRG